VDIKVLFLQAERPPVGTSSYRYDSGHILLGTLKIFFTAPRVISPNYGAVSPFHGPVLSGDALYGS